jgi:hypothetical protein
MPVTIVPYAQDHVSAVAEFNKRLAAGGIAMRFPESPIPRWLPRRSGIPVYQEYFVALEQDKVRGAYVLKPQAFACHGEVTMLAMYTLPISEGILDRRYAMVGLLMLRDALQRQSVLFSLGMGGYREPIARMLKAMKWGLVSVPFYFRVIHPVRFLREMVFLRRNRFLEIMLDQVAFSGLGWVAITLLQSAKAMAAKGTADVEGEEVETFSSWADEIWEKANGHYALIAVRNAVILNTLYPRGDDRFRRIRVLRRGTIIGWAVVLHTKMERHKFFGNMRVGTVVDCLAIEGEERGVAAAATRLLTGWGVDMIVTNQLHRSWGKAFSGNGYLSGPSNYIFGASPGLCQTLDPWEVHASRVHMTRGDGDGPVHL